LVRVADARGGGRARLRFGLNTNLTVADLRTNTRAFDLIRTLKRKE